ncbi:hypothetical protein BGZ65_010224 [Modicella reniformis]|uniref:Uncharacterized protein n=1 Tax=Modicella reniformis TaxID=1440133 RepID=A0A9P6LRW4_9FUNG|nr:hypothetical protein BGZ65_010224 [Modicella reniformis]
MSSLSSSSSWQHQQQYGYFDSETTTEAHLRTNRRLEHKQAFARHAASAPELHVHPQAWTTTSSTITQHSSSPISYFAPEIPAPPPRMLHFRSREPSAVPACPYPLCQKPILLTKSRRERGVTIWIVCGLLFLCNAYWTTHAIMSQFSIGPYQDGDRQRVLSDKPLEGSSSAEAATGGFSFKREIVHLVKGFLGFKAQQFKGYKPESRRATIATVGVLQDEQSMLRMILGFVHMSMMALIRWCLCWTPLLFRPLFDTVHSCPYPHPYPYPEELEHERKELEKKLQEQADKVEKVEKVEKVGHKKQDKVKKRNGPDELQIVAPVPFKEQSSDTIANEVHGSASEKQVQAGDNVEDQDDPSNSVPAPGLRVLSSSKSSPQHRETNAAGSATRFQEHQEHQECDHSQVLESTVTHIDKKQLSWGARRALRKAEEKRQQIIKATQDIGRYSLLYEFGASLAMDRWKQAVLAPGQIQPEAYED